MAATRDTDEEFGPRDKTKVTPVPAWRPATDEIEPIFKYPTESYALKKIREAADKRAEEERKKRMKKIEDAGKDELASPTRKGGR